MRRHVWQGLGVSSPVLGDSRDLGAHITVYRRLASATISARIQRAVAVSYTHLTLPTICSV
eukprot:14567643-Alexandrium_andersonii.AAC.1